METWKESQLKQLTFAKGVDAAYPILLRFAENLGFNFCEISVVSLHRDLPLKTLQINNYPKEWNLQYEENRYSKVDPLIAHCNHSMTPICLVRISICRRPADMGGITATWTAKWLVAVVPSRAEWLVQYYQPCPKTLLDQPSGAV